MSRRTTILLPVALLATLAAVEAFGYELIFPWRRWFPEELPREVYVDPRGRASVNDADHGLTATMIHIERWETAQGVGQLLVPIVGTESDPEAVPPYSGGDGVSVLRFDDPVGICTGTCIAATTTGGINLAATGSCNGYTWVKWTDSDIVFNNANIFTTEEETASEGGCSGEYYLEQIAVHEVGHLLGMGHSEDSSAVMWAYAGYCQSSKINPRQDDLSGIRVPYACAFSRNSVYADSDGDGYGQDTDCDDQDPSVYPGAAEVCDLKDTDCDGSTDGDEGLECGDACILAQGGPGQIRLDRGGCTGEAAPGFRNVYVRGVLDDLHSSGGVSAVTQIGCPAPTVYDRIAESSDLSSTTGWYYLTRDEADPDYGKDSAGEARLPSEETCP